MHGFPIVQNQGISKTALISFYSGLLILLLTDITFVLSNFPANRQSPLILFIMVVIAAISAISAVIFGIIALKRRRSYGKLNLTCAIAGLTIGFLFIVFVSIFIIYGYLLPGTDIEY